MRLLAAFFELGASAASMTLVGMLGHLGGQLWPSTQRQKRQPSIPGTRILRIVRFGARKAHKEQGLAVLRAEGMPAVCLRLPWGGAASPCPPGAAPGRHGLASRTDRNYRWKVTCNWPTEVVITYETCLSTAPEDRGRYTRTHPPTHVCHQVSTCA